MSILSTHGYITINADDNVSIDSNSNVTFNEFNQATINISYIPTVQRARTAFVVTEISGASVDQIVYRSDVVAADGRTQYQITGGVATLFLQSQVGRTPNISRGIIGANKLRPSGKFTVKIDLYSSSVPSGLADTVVDTLIINGEINPSSNNPFSEPLEAIATVGNQNGQYSYNISLSENDMNFLPYFGGFKISNIAPGVTIKKGFATISNGQIIASQSGTLSLTSTGGGSTVSFNVTAVDVDAQERTSSVLLSLFNYNSISLTPTYSGFIDPGTVPINNVKTSDGYGIWSTSERSRTEGRIMNGSIVLTLSNNVPDGTDITWTVTSKALDNNSNPVNLVSVNGKSMVNGVIGNTVSNLGLTNNSFTLEFVALENVSGNMLITCQASNGQLTQQLNFNSNLSSLPIQVFSNPSEPNAIPKRIYLSDNMSNYLIVPTLDDHENWNDPSNPVDGSLTITEDDTICNEKTPVGNNKVTNNIYTRLIDASQQTNLNLNYADHDNNGNSQFSSAGNLGLSIDTQTLNVTIDDTSNPTGTPEFVVNPNASINTSNSYMLVDPTGSARSTVITISGGGGTTTTTTTTIYNYSIFNSNNSGLGTLGSSLSATNNTSPTIDTSSNQSILDAAYFVQIGNAQVSTAATVSGDQSGVTTVYTYDISDDCIAIRPNGFYGKVLLNYQIKQLLPCGNYLQSFNKTTTTMYILPRPNPQVSITRMLKDDYGNVNPTYKNTFLASNYTEYQLTVQNGSSSDYDYINPESDANIKKYLVSLQKLHIDYKNNVVPKLVINGRQSSNNNIVSFDKISAQVDSSSTTFEDELNWYSNTQETSSALYDLDTSTTAGGSFTTSFIIQFNNPNFAYTGGLSAQTSSDTISVFVSDPTVVNNINAGSSYQVLGVPVIKGFAISHGYSLISTDGNYIGKGLGSAGDISTCSTVVIKNIGNSDIIINTTDLTESSGTNNAIYVNSEGGGSDVTIAPGYARVFIRIMFKPEAWEPMDADYAPQ